MFVNDLVRRSTRRGAASTSMVAIGAMMLALAACRGCTSTDSTVAGAVGTLADASPDRTQDASIEGRPDTLDADAVPADTPSESTVDSGCALSNWQSWTGWSDQCPIYVPGPGCELPSPIDWEPCPPPVPQNIACKRMKNTWGGTVSPFPKFWRDPTSGAGLILFTREQHPSGSGSAVRLIAAVDGPVRMAQFYADYHNSECAYAEEDMSDGRYVLNAVSHKATTTEQALLGATVETSAPLMLMQVQNPSTMFTSGFRISSAWIAQLTLGAIKAWAWDLTTSAMVYEAGKDPNGLQPHVPIVRGSDIFFSAGNLTLCGVMSWNPNDGVRPLLRRYSDSTWAAGTFGTDGKDMVWTQSQGANACNNDGPNPEVWTAPYTTDPVVLKATARRVRADVRGMSPDGYAVGFGYAARCDGFGSPQTPSLSIVRLSDGYRWTVPGNNTQTLHWNQPLGLTDQEVLVTGVMANAGSTIFRIRLDSLGPGTPPD